MTSHVGHGNRALHESLHSHLSNIHSHLSKSHPHVSGLLHHAGGIATNVHGIGHHVHGIAHGLFTSHVNNPENPKPNNVDHPKSHHNAADSHGDRHNTTD